jgi:putative ATP-binding cassette transporter
MKLIAYLWKQSPLLMLLSLAGAAATAVLMMLLLRLISSHIEPGAGELPGWELFALLAAGSIVTQLLSSITISRASVKAVTRLRSSLVREVAAAPLPTIEALGSTKILTCLMSDTTRLSSALPGVVGLLRDLVFAAGCLGYLAWLSPRLLGLLTAVIVVGAFLQVPLQRRGSTRQRDLRSVSDHMNGLFKDLIDGFRQIKLSERQRGEVLGELGRTEVSFEKAHVEATAYFTAANAMAVSLFLLCVAAMIYLPGVGVEPSVLATYILIMLLLLAPLQTISSALQQFGHAGVALSRIQQLRASLVHRSEGTVPEAAVVRAHTKLTLELRGLSHDYMTGDRQTFHLGPVDATVRSGETLFIVGGNGSGKTTLVKLLCGLYSPKEGALLLNGEPVEEAGLNAYRAQVGAVFFDNCLFAGLAGTSADERGSEHQDELRRLRLDGVIEPAGGLYAQAASCSTGERKRLALLLALREDKPIMIFDEFAADQDPECKELFYRQILPDLKRQGCAVVVVTHDDRFFSEADHILTLERGMPPLFRSHGAAPVVAMQADAVAAV